MQHLSEKQTVLANITVMKQLLLNRNQTQNKTKKKPTTSVALLPRYGVFWGREEEGKPRWKGMQLESNPLLSPKNFSHYCCLAGNSFEDYVHMIYASFIHTTFSNQVFLFPGNEVHLAAFLHHVTILHREYFSGV